MQVHLAAMTPVEYSSYNSAIAQKFFEIPIVKNSNRVMMYYSIHHEVETTLLIKMLFTMGKSVALPACTLDKSLRALVIQDLDDLVPGIFGLSEPKDTAPEIKSQELDLIIVPGLAFDKRGFRLGHGGGYYDRFLAKTFALKLGLAYDFQVVEELPVDHHDIPLDALLTVSDFQVFDHLR
jgi:5-formyltetrahydrofolate cyclo-ligase